MRSVLILGMLSGFVFGLQNTLNTETQSSLQSPRPEQRIEALEALVHNWGDGSILPVAKALEDSDPFVRSAANSVLRHVGKPATEALLTRFRSYQTQSDRIRAASQLLNLAGKFPDGENYLSAESREQLLKEASAVLCPAGPCVREWAGPHYPNLARSALIEGRVWATFTIDSTGTPDQISVTGHTLLVGQISEVIKKWRYVRRDSVGQDVQSVTFEFRLVGLPRYSPSDVSELVLPNYVIVASPPLMGSP